jgi:hypothetical protein
LKEKKGKLGVGDPSVFRGLKMKMNIKAVDGVDLFGADTEYGEQAWRCVETFLFLMLEAGWELMPLYST